MVEFANNAKPLLDKLIIFYEFVLMNRNDPYENGHSRRVCQYAIRLANKIKQSTLFMETLYYGARLHDVGKILCPVELLNKEHLTDSEFRVMKQHARNGFMLVQSLNINGRLLRMIAEHHENYDGSGYNLKLAGEEISQGARIICICDRFDAMTSARPYGIKRSPGEAIAEMVRCQQHYDPELFSIFQEMMICQ